MSRMRCVALVVVVVLLLTSAAVQAQGDYNCTNPVVSPSGVVPIEIVSPHVFMEDEPSAIPDPMATGAPQDEYIISVCTQTVKTPKGTQPCGKKSFYAARWRGGDNACIDVYDNPVARKVGRARYEVEFTSLNNTNNKLVVAYICGSSSKPSFNRSGDVIMWTFETTKSPMCAPPTLVPAPGPPATPEPPTTPTPDSGSGGGSSSGGGGGSGSGSDGGGNNQNGGDGNHNNNSPYKDIDQEKDGLSAISVFLIVLGVAAVVVLLFVIIDLKRKNSMLHRIVSGPEHPHEELGDSGRREEEGGIAREPVVVGSKAL